MRTFSTIISYFGGFFWSILGIVICAKGSTGIFVYYENGGPKYYDTYHANTPSRIWILSILCIVLRIIILIYRHKSLNNGNKIGCGVFTLLFVSIIGGICTLTIPNDELG